MELIDGHNFFMTSITWRLMLGLFARGKFITRVEIGETGSQRLMT